MKIFKGDRFLLTAITGLFLLLLLTAQKPQFQRESLYLNKTSNDKPTRTLLNINNISYWQYYDGRSGINPDGNAGVKYPRGTAGVISRMALCGAG